MPNLRRSVKWGMSYYGVGDGWCFCCGAFAGHVKLMFVNGAALEPVPPVTPVGMGKSTRGVGAGPPLSGQASGVRSIGSWISRERGCMAPARSSRSSPGDQRRPTGQSAPTLPQ
ncbi:DUF1801 domain-containing protein [Arthrobacter sp. SIMBA_036]|uniref:hypothetical protein n=1 Tax=Arthrobacter sp. SIMBA_036 TaxID=3085778 RepID=UPI0039785486